MPAKEVAKKGWVTKLEAKQRFQTSVLTRLSLLEFRSAAGAWGTTGPTEGTTTTLTGVGDAAASGRSLEVAATQPGMAGESGSLHHMGTVWPWGPRSVQVAPASPAAPLPSILRQLFQLQWGMGLCSNRAVQCRLTGDIGVTQFRASHVSFPVGDMSFPLREHLLPATKEKIIQGEFADFFLLLYRELEKKDKQDLDEKEKEIVK